ncbi:TonB-dependent alcaligin siderophore receptor FauA [Oceanimonas baumannii]|uniref:Outer membrane receptor for ferric coprogen and ferric-rhodotorulic acid n=1 Tax=Oceanimonas baumannii TaxID=129578 RepID=A0A235CDT1_9GAMM|nr:TonB-dependent siderophore receptor [Oceanimonas baumannii]OYD22778.1 TonB-dependent siderophore receptor [Oceanimonas baumannii]TDW57745.1 outer membrane receptor for ferric coprogen and ferric-rhodotorulic acid [Oceanimonas baumannii]
MFLDSFALHRAGRFSPLIAPLLLSVPVSAEEIPLELNVLDEMVVTGRQLSADSEQRDSYTPGASTTATSLPLSIKETPQAVSVITHQQIKDQGLITSGEILHRAPGVSMTRSDSNRFNYSSRGYSISTYQFDGLMTPIQGYWNFGDTDWDGAIYDRIEVVRGATGLLTGAGDPSASVNFIRKKPLPEFAARVSGDLGSWDQRRLMADVSAPLGDSGRTAVRLIAVRDRQDTHVDNMEHDKETYYGVINSQLTPNTDVSLGVEYQHNQTDGAGGGFPMFYADGSQTDFDHSASNNTRWSRFFNETTRAFIDVNHFLDNSWRLRAAYSYDDGNYGLTYLFRSGFPDRHTGEGMSAYFANYRGDRRRQDVHFTAEGPFELLGRDHEAAFGWVRTQDDLDMRLASPAGATPDIGAYINGQGAPVAEPEWGAYGSVDDSKLVQSGAYAVSRLSLADPLHLVAGIRLSNWELEQVYFGDERQYSYNNELTPYAGLIYDFNDRVSGYVSYTEIFQTQNVRSADGSLLDPITGRNYEVGLKATLADELEMNLAVFRSEQNGLGEAIPGETVNGRPDTQAYRATDGATVEGFETELVGSLAPGWNLNASFTLANPISADGDRMNTTHPRQQAKLFTSYQFDGDWHPLRLGGGLRWQSKIYRDTRGPAGTTRLTQGSYSVVDLMARYDITPELSAQLNLNNVFDKEYHDQVGFYSQGWWGEPRNLRLSLSYDF